MIPINKYNIDEYNDRADEELLHYSRNDYIQINGTYYTLRSVGRKPKSTNTLLNFLRSVCSSNLLHVNEEATKSIGTLYYEFNETRFEMDFNIRCFNPNDCIINYHLLTIPNPLEVLCIDCLTYSDIMAQPTRFEFHLDIRPGDRWYIYVYDNTNPSRPIFVADFYIYQLLNDINKYSSNMTNEDYILRDEDMLEHNQWTDVRDVTKHKWDSRKRSFIRRRQREHWSLIDKFSK